MGKQKHNVQKPRQERVKQELMNLTEFSLHLDFLHKKLFDLHKA